MKIKELRERNKTEFKLYMSFSTFHDGDTLCRRIVLQKDGIPKYISEDYEILHNGEWISPHIN